MRIERLIAKIDSSSTMLGVVVNYLKGKPLPGLGFVPPSRLLGALANAPPKALRQFVYIFGGRSEAATPKQIVQLRAEDISQWAVKAYPKRRYPAVMIGSSNGALMHLCAALKIPWLPQTILVPVRRSKRISPDQLKADVEAFRDTARRLLDLNPELQVNQMHDPVQDRLMIQQMGYFRIKRLKLGATYEAFLKEHLLPGATILVSECAYQWPMKEVSPRHFFQTGGYGGLGAKEYLRGGRRVAGFLKAQGSNVRRWDSPPPDVLRPEAEWGFEPELLFDLRRFARENGFKIQRIRYNDPADASVFVAELYRWWYRQRGFSDDRLFAESFLLLDPWWCLRTGAVPFWMVFNTGSSAQELTRYIKEFGPFGEIYITLFANAIQGIDQTLISEWKEIFKLAKRSGDLVGVDQERYPFDLGVYFRFHPELQRKIKARLPMPKSPLTLSQLTQFRIHHPDERLRFITDKTVTTRHFFLRRPEHVRLAA